MTSPSEPASSPSRSKGLLAAGVSNGALLILACVVQLFVQLPALKAGIALLVAIYALLLLGFVFSRLRWRWTVVLPGLLVYYIGVEHLLAPFVMHVFEMETYYYTRNPDHWPAPAETPPGMNSDLLRCRWEPDEFAPEGLNVLFLGDSFTFGAELDADQTFAYHLTDRLRDAFPEVDLKTANFGWSSSSPFLDLRRLEALGERYHPDLVALFVDMTDFQDDIKWRRRLERRGVYWWVYHFPFAMHVFERQFPEAFESFYWTRNEEVPRRRFFITEAPLTETRPHCREILDNIDRLNEWCGERDARFVVYILPRSYQYSDRECPNNWEKGEYEILGPHCLEPFRLFGEQRERVDYPIRSLLDAFRSTGVFPTCFPDDPHWNPAGARVATEAIFPGLKADVGQLLEE